VAVQEIDDGAINLERHALAWLRIRHLASQPADEAMNVP
jgi:hypothetical protein